MRCMRRYVTVANMARSFDWTILDGYTISATCMPANDVPCPRPNPMRGPCGDGPEPRGSRVQRGLCTDSAVGHASGNAVSLMRAILPCDAVPQCMMKCMGPNMHV